MKEEKRQPAHLSLSKSKYPDHLSPGERTIALLVSPKIRHAHASQEASISIPRQSVGGLGERSPAVLCAVAASARDCSTGKAQLGTTHLVVSVIRDSYRDADGDVQQE